jgi:predicted O-methyltransferase YrrM
MTDTFKRYQLACATQSDIQHHLGLLFSLARGNVLELGTRGGVSTVALLAGVERSGGHVWSLDIEDCSGVLPAHPQWTFTRGDSTDTALYETFGKTTFDLVLIDTEHTYEQSSAELALWDDRVAPGGSICMHDIETFPGVRRAAREFAARVGWPITYVLPCHGMAVIERPA